MFWEKGCFFFLRKSTYFLRGQTRPFFGSCCKLMVDFFFFCLVSRIFLKFPFMIPTLHNFSPDQFIPENECGIWYPVIHAGFILAYTWGEGESVSNIMWCWAAPRLAHGAAVTCQSGEGESHMMLGYKLALLWNKQDHFLIWQNPVLKRIILHLVGYD